MGSISIFLSTKSVFTCLSFFVHCMFVWNFAPFGRHASFWIESTPRDYRTKLFFVSCTYSKGSNLKTYIYEVCISIFKLKSNIKKLNFKLILIYLMVQVNRGCLNLNSMNFKYMNQYVKSSAITSFIFIIKSKKVNILAVIWFKTVFFQTFAKVLIIKQLRF